MNTAVATFENLHAAANHSTATEDLVWLSKSLSPRIRRSVAANLRTPKYVLRFMVNDDDSRVANAASFSLTDRLEAEHDNRMSRRAERLARRAHQMIDQAFASVPSRDLVAA